MKKAYLGAQVTQIKGLEFDGGKMVAYSLEDGRSFMLAAVDPAVKKIGLGDELDVTFTSETRKPAVLKSGAEVDFFTMNGVTIIDIKRSTFADKFKDLPDVDNSHLVFTDYTTTGASSGEQKEGGSVGKM